MSRSGLTAGRPHGRITRGTTNINRLRRIDRAMASDRRIRQALAVAHPLAVDLGTEGVRTPPWRWRPGCEAWFRT